MRWTANHGGKPVLASDLMLADRQRGYFFGVLRERIPGLLPLYQRLHPPGSYGAVLTGDRHAIGRQIHGSRPHYYRLPTSKHGSSPL